MKKTPKIAPPTPNTDTQQLEYQSINTSPYSSSDLDFVAFLKSRYALKVVSVSRDAHGRVQWAVNLGHLRLDDLFNDYVSGITPFPCATFVAQQRVLKAQLRML